MFSSTGIPAEATLTGRKPGAMGLGPEGEDIFALVKENLSSKEVCQDPLLVWPASLQSKAHEAFRLANDRNCPVIRCEIEDARVQELRALRAAFRRDFPQMTRVAGWYDTMINGTGVVETPTTLSFLRDARARRVDWSEFQLGSRAPGLRPHELQVVFHRGGR